jgi:hypothetical protein
MSATAVAVPIQAGRHAGRPWAHAIRIALVCLAVVVLVALSFVLGRTTVTSTRHTLAPVPVGQGSTDLCRIGHAC